MFQELGDIEVLSETDQALKAATLYSADATFADISEQLGISKSHAQVLTRRGIRIFREKMNKDNNNLKEVIMPIQIEQIPIMIPQLDQMPETHIFETQVTTQKIILTPRCLMIYNLWRRNGFNGELSNFLESATEFLYNSLNPRERMLHARTRKF